MSLARSPIPCTRALGVVTALAAATACGDPVHDLRVEALGPEAPDVPPGPNHRPGQPCVTCHESAGPGKPAFRFGGTIYAVKGQTAGLGGVTIHLVDATGATLDATTNSVGNFYIAESSWNPVMPVHVSLEYQAQKAEMSTHIGRNGSCGDCHFDPPGKASPGRVYLVADPEDLPGGSP